VTFLNECGDRIPHVVTVGTLWKRVTLVQNYSRLTRRTECYCLQRSNIQFGRFFHFEPKRLDSFSSCVPTQSTRLKKYDQDFQISILILLKPCLQVSNSNCKLPCQVWVVSLSFHIGKTPNTIHITIVLMDNDTPRMIEEAFFGILASQRNL
jgi:hypothetical protein